MKQELIEWVKSIIFAIIIVGVMNIFITTTMVYSTSMYPTLKEKDLLILRRTHDIQRGDIVSLNSSLKLTESDISGLNFIQKLKASPGDAKKLIKRVIGLPGDHIEIKAGVLYINGKMYKENYISSEMQETLSVKIPDGQYFLMGDNRANSLDSRNEMVGLINEEDIIGNVIFRIYPLNRLGKVN